MLSFLLSLFSSFLPFFLSSFHAFLPNHALLSFLVSFYVRKNFVKCGKNHTKWDGFKCLLQHTVGCSNIRCSYFRQPKRQHSVLIADISDNVEEEPDWPATSQPSQPGQSGFDSFYLTLVAMFDNQSGDCRNICRICPAMSTMTD